MLKMASKCVSYNAKSWSRLDDRPKLAYIYGRKSSRDKCPT